MPRTHEVAGSVRSEFFLAAKGKVVRRAEGTVNAELPTGEIEVAVTECEVLNSSPPPPISIEEGEAPAEDLRLKYRYLDLRRPEMQRNIRQRHRAVKAVRDYLDEQGFIEVETPILFKSTPEGARDYLVPSRVNPGKFYALPQSPQLLKQLLMVGGFDRYFQIARCFRDEDLRANRQPEFTQIDIEMTCPRPEDIMGVAEGMMASVFEKVLGVDVKPPFPRMSYAEAMERFGVDKPDLRFGMELKNLGSGFRRNFVQGFCRSARALRRASMESSCRARISSAARTSTQWSTVLKVRHGLGLAWIKVNPDGWQGPIAKYLGETEKNLATRIADLKTGDTMLMIAGDADKVRPILGDIRLQLSARFNLRETGERKFLWVVDFPLFEFNDEEKRLFSVNHPFTAPNPDDLKILESQPLGARALAYDMVLNGEEMGGGSIRIHSRELQLKVLELLGLTREEALDRFGFLIEALTYGAPPHGGIAFGVDRLIMMLCGTESIRDVIAFPKTQKAVDLMSGAPSEVSPRQLKELSIKVTL